VSTSFIFDLDGTLIDSRSAICASLRHVQQSYGLGVSEENDLGWALGPPLREIMCRLLGVSDARAIEEAVARYRTHHWKASVEDAQVFPGIAEALHNLGTAGHPLFVCTSKAESVARRVLAHFELTQYFRLVYGTDDAGHVASKQDLLQTLLHHEGLLASDAVMIGDREHDIRGAKAVGARSCGVTWGYASARELENADPDWMCSRPDQLLGIVTCPQD
jgi:phosphoglycolate phosphatase